MTIVPNTKIEEQRKRVLGNHPDVKLIAPCKLGEGILSFSETEKLEKIALFEKLNFTSSFFIPASGSGSRMFQFLFDFLDDPNEENRSQVERFLNHISDFAFFQQLPIDIRKKLKNHDVELDEFVSYLLNSHGMGYGDLPKGLIPFHKNDPFILTPFQEHILQGSKVVEENINFHFTVQSFFKTKIQKVIQNIQGLTGQLYHVDFTEQNNESNAIAFKLNGEVCQNDEGEVLERPAGHGALLENLNSIDSDLIFIKNIDNIQHFSKSNDTIHTWKYLGGVLLDYRNEAKNIFENPTIEKLISLNKKYQLYNSENYNNLSLNEMLDLLNRPIRVCGMVKNEGQPGGGPFWIQEGENVSKQIVEKSQITMRGEQYRLMVQSSYFNPVMIVASSKDLTESKFDLTHFKDDSKFFVVKKKYKGQDIRFIELPGLWNGSMAHWNSIFIEIPSTTFSPVKTVLDLLENTHL
ncbi:MAG: DUF4301 family protein [Flavobacteriia bacterium]|nr:DUF4301 family protein [Flavobacteriia bacterium]